MPGPNNPESTLDTTLQLISLAGAVALLLWGMHMVQTGIQRAFGSKLRAVLARTLRRRFSAVVSGAGITLLLQSSTATGLLVTNLAANGMIEFIPAMAVMLGANIGTALIVAILSFNVSMLSAPLILLGVVLFRSDRNPTAHDLGRVFIGLGLMLLALHQMLAVLGPIEHSADVRTILGVLEHLPAIAILLGAVAAWAVHASVAVVLLVASFATYGTISLETAGMLVLGANLGTALNPLFEAAADNPMARRVPLANLGNRVVGIAIAWPLMPWIVEVMQWGGLGRGTATATMHLAFNLILAVVTLPLLGPIARLLQLLVPDRTNEDDPAKPRHLDTSVLEFPVVALGNAAREALRLADALESMLEEAREAVSSGNRRRISATRERDDILDALNSAIKAYLAKLDPDLLSEDDRSRLNQILVFASNMEQAGDFISGSLLPHASKRFKRGLPVEERQEQTLESLIDRLIANTRLAASLFMTEDTPAARALAEEKLAFRKAEEKATAEHFSRMHGQSRAEVQGDALHVDLVRDLKLINSHIVAAAAYPVLERSGELLKSRLAPHEP